MTRSLALLAAVSFALGGGMANAAGDRWPSDAKSSESHKTEFKKLDTNKDGRVSKTEAEANSALQAEFDKLDGNMNGSLDQAEFARFEAESSGGEEQPMERGR